MYPVKIFLTFLQMNLWKIAISVAFGSRPSPPRSSPVSNHSYSSVPRVPNAPPKTGVLGREADSVNNLHVIFERTSMLGLVGAPLIMIGHIGAYWLPTCRKWWVVWNLCTLFIVNVIWMASFALFIHQFVRKKKTDKRSMTPSFEGNSKGTTTQNVL